MSDDATSSHDFQCGADLEKDVPFVPHRVGRRLQPKEPVGPQWCAISLMKRLSCPLHAVGAYGAEFDAELGVDVGVAHETFGHCLRLGHYCLHRNGVQVARLGLGGDTCNFQRLR